MTQARRVRIIIAGIATLVIIAMISLVWFMQRDSSSGQLDDALLQEIAIQTAATLAGDSSRSAQHSYLQEPAEAVYVALRQEGRRVGSAWSKESARLRSLQSALEEAREKSETTDIDTVEICFSARERSVELGDAELSNVHRGVFGLSAKHQDQSARYSPTLMLEQNWDFERALQQFSQAHNVPDLSLIKLAVFDCDQVLVELSDSARAVQMWRGSQLVDVAEVSEERVRKLERDLALWLENNLEPSGKMTYKYWPSRQELSTANNMIRQWMATVAMIRSGTDPERTKENIQFNLDNFYRQDGEYGLIEYDGKVKLGAVALAALALKEHPNRSEFRTEEESLQRTIEHLWQPNGAFKTFYLPEGRNDNQNFYPGEALVYWAELYEETKDSVLLGKFMRSFNYYREWHLEESNRNPAFIPWHTQAYFQLWQETENEELADFIFEMNDWLLGVQEWDESAHPDLRGRFYDSERPEFGAPHSSSTGVYLEGLIDAYRLAQALGDEKRAENYRVAIARGLRSVIQLQFNTPSDMYYIQEPNRVFGGVRTTMYDNEIRVDNVQHNLMGVLKILESFSPDDYRIR